MDRNLLANATSSDDTPTPGYMLNEIAKCTLSSYQANVQIQEYLVARLAKNNYNVKFKCLVIIKHICRIGRPEFKREMGRNVDTIKECLQYKGPPDPLRGDEIYKRVRDAARETLDAIFDSQMSMTTSAVAAANRIQGLGNNYTPEDSTKKQGNQGILSSIVSTLSSTIKGEGSEDPMYEGHPGAVGYFVRPSASYTSDSTYAGNNSSEYATGNSSVSSGNGMSGYGNPNFKDVREEKTLLQIASAMSASGIASISSYASSKIGSTSTPDVVNRAQNDRDEYQYASNRGPNSVLYGNTYHSNRPWQQGADPADSSGLSKVGSAASDGEYERKWVQSLCEPGGLKAVPPEDKLVSFMAIVPTLSPETIGSCLVEVFNSEAWQSRTKALAVLFNILSSEDCEVHKQWWIDHKDCLSDMLSDSKVSVRSQAVKTMQLIDHDAVVNVDLKVDASVSGSSDKRKSAGSSEDAPRLPEAVPVVAVTSLLDSYDLLSDDIPPPASPAAVANPVSSGGGLFAGLTLGSASPSSSEVPTQPSLLPSTSTTSGNVVGLPAPQNNYVPESVPGTPAKNSVNNLFDHFDSLLDAPLPPVPAPPAVTEPESHGFDFISKANTNPLSDLSILDLNLPPSSHEDAFSMLSSGRPSSSAPSSVMISGKQLSSDIALNGSAASSSKQESSFTELLQMSGMPSSTPQASYRSPPQQRLPPNAAPYPSQLHPQQRYPYPQQPQPGYNYSPQQQMMHPSQQQQQQMQMQMPYYQPQPNPQYSNAAYSQQPQIAVNRPGVPMNTSAILPGMLNPMAPRKDIPLSDSAGNSGFSFLGGAGPRGPPAGPQKDSFSFVTEEMKSLRK